MGLLDGLEVRRTGKFISVGRLRRETDEVAVQLLIALSRVFGPRVALAIRTPRAASGKCRANLFFAHLRSGLPRDGSIRDDRRIQMTGEAKPIRIESL